MSTTVATMPAAAPRVSNKWMIAVAVSIGALLEIIDTSIVNVALTDMQNTLGATVSEIGWVVSSYGIANVIILPLTAWLGERFGKKRYFIFSLIAFTVSSVLCGMATSLPMLIAARVLQGLGGGGLLAKAQSILFETFPKQEQAMAQGLFGAIVIAGPAIGPTLGGYLVTNINWRWIFLVNVPVGIVAVLMCVAFLADDDVRERIEGAVDWSSIALLVVGLGALQTVLEEGQTDDWFESPFITTLAVFAAVGLVTFVWRSLTAKAPIVDLRVLRHRSLWAGSILSVITGMVLYGALFSIPIFASAVMGYSSQQTGMLLLPGAIASALTMPIAAKLMSRFDARALIAIGAAVLTCGVLGLARLSPSTGAEQLYWPLIIRSVGTPLMFLPLSMATLGPIPKKDLPAASAFFNLTRQLGGSIGVALLTTLLARRQAFHRNVLVEKLGAIAPDALARLHAYTVAMLGRGYALVEAKAKALALLDGGVNLQSAVLSFGDTFLATAVLIVVSLPLVLVLGKPPTGAKVEVGH
jgi:MFS transporter, DHA2 family, multidrug resistance protein